MQIAHNGLKNLDNEIFCNNINEKYYVYTVVVNPSE